MKYLKIIIICGVISGLLGCKSIVQSYPMASAQLSQTAVRVVSGNVKLRITDKQLENQLYALFNSTAGWPTARYKLEIDLTRRRISVNVRDPRTADRFKVIMTAHYRMSDNDKPLLEGNVGGYINYEETMNRYQNYHAEAMADEDQVHNLAYKIYLDLLMKLEDGLTLEQSSK